MDCWSVWNQEHWHNIRRSDDNLETACVTFINMKISALSFWISSHDCSLFTPPAWKLTSNYDALSMELFKLSLKVETDTGASDEAKFD